MKKVILLVFAIVVCTVAKSQEYAMVVQYTDGTENTYQYSDLTDMYFQGDTVVFNKGDVDGTVAVKFSDIAKIYFKSVTALNDQSEDGIVFLYPNPSRTSFKIAGAQNSGYEMYSMDGRLVKKGINTGDEIDISSLVKGVYAVKINAQTFKFSKL